jgi:hypothetical protein
MLKDKLIVWIFPQPRSNKFIFLFSHRPQQISCCHEKAASFGLVAVWKGQIKSPAEIHNSLFVSDGWQINKSIDYFSLMEAGYIPSPSAWKLIEIDILFGLFNKFINRWLVIMQIILNEDGFIRQIVVVLYDVAQVDRSLAPVIDYRNIGNAI